MRITKLVQSCLFIETKDNLNILIDPANRFFEKDFSYDFIESLDYILITHAHNDHIFDVKYLSEKFPNVIIYSKIETGNILEQEIGVKSKLQRFNLGGSFKIGNLTSIKIVDANHSSSYNNIYGGNACGFIISDDVESTYISGDTSAQINYNYIAHNFNIDKVYLVMDGNYNMDVYDAIYVMKNYFKDATCYPYHFMILSDTEKKEALEILKKSGVKYSLQ